MLIHSWRSFTHAMSSEGLNIYCKGMNHVHQLPRTVNTRSRTKQTRKIGKGEEIRLCVIFTINVAQPWWLPRHFSLHYLIRIFDYAYSCGQDGPYGPCPLWWSLCQASGMWTWNEHKIRMNNYTMYTKYRLAVVLSRFDSFSSLASMKWITHTGCAPWHWSFPEAQRAP